MIRQRHFNGQSGPETVTLPSYAGYSYENAVNALAQLGISDSQITRVDQASDTVEPGLVITQDPHQVAP